VLLKQTAKIAKGANNPRTEKVGTVTQNDLLNIAKIKFEDLNAPNLEQAAKIIAGTARSMGIEVVE
jgi:large subunit ribosomal protein L11